MAFADPEPPDPAEGIGTTPSSDNATPTSLQQAHPQQQRARHEQAETQTAPRLPHTAATRHERNISSINIGGYQYTRAWSSRRKIVYRCSYYRGTGCMGKVEFLAASMKYGNFIQHTCQQDHVVAAPTVDIMEPMREAVDDLARSDVALSAAAIWSRINDQFYGGAQNQALIGLTREQALSRVYRARNRHFGGNIHGRIEMPPLSRVSDRPLNFFQFHYITGFNDSDLPSKIIGWAHPELIALLKYAGIPLFVDGTFRCVPRGFQQCVVVMVHDRSSGKYVPVFYVLATHRTRPTYNSMFQFIQEATGNQLEPSEFVCDFERALIDAVGDQFPNADAIGCLFHFKQAIRQ